MGRTRLTLEEKRKILEDSKKPGFKRKNVVEKYGIAESTLSSLLSKREEFLSKLDKSVSITKRKSLKSSRMPELQPCDQGIIAALKAHYRSLLNRRICTLAEGNDFKAEDLVKKIRVIDALYLLDEAWKKVTPQTIQNCFNKAFKAEAKSDLNELLHDVELPAGIEDRQQYFGPLLQMEANFEADVELNLHLEDSDEDEEEVEEEPPKPELKNTEVLQMLEKIRGHMVAKPGVQSEWIHGLNGLESVLIKEIENERRVQPRITNYFSKTSQSGQSGQVTVTSNSNDNNNSNESEIHFI